MELSPENRRRIYLEEKARMEIRRQLEPKKTSAGTVIFWIISGVVGLFILLIVIGSFQEQSERDKFNALTPAQRDAKEYADCVELEQGWLFKTYSEMSVEERKIKLSCDLLLADRSKSK